MKIFLTGAKEKHYMKKLISLLLILLMMFPFTACMESAVFGTGKVYVRKSGGTLHLREEASAESQSLGIVHHGDEIHVLDLGDVWSYIYSFRVGMDGYIKTKYIVDFVPAENMYTESYIKYLGVTSLNFPIPGKFEIDLDGDAVIDTVDISLHYDEYGMEYFRLIFVTAFGSSGEATIPFSSYDASVTFARFDESGKVFTFLTGDVASSDYETYGFYVNEGHMENVTFSPLAPFEEGIGIAGRLSGIEDGIMTVESVLDVLGTRFYEHNLVCSDGNLVSEDRSVFVARMDFEDMSVWDLAMVTKTELRCQSDAGEKTLPKGEKLIVTWLDWTNQKIGFVTESGTEGYFSYTEAEQSYYWGVMIDGIYEEDAFENILYAG